MTRQGVDPVGLITQLNRLLRERRINATPSTSIDAVRALGAIDASDKSDVHLALRSVCVSRRQDLELFDELFEAWWMHLFGEPANAAKRRAAAARNPAVVSPTDE